MIKQFNKQNLKQVREEINKGLSELSDKIGIKLEIGAIRFDNFTFTTKMSAKINSPEAIVATQIKYPSGISQGQIINLNGQIFKVTGYNPRRHKFPIIVEEISTNKSFRLPLRAAIERG